MILQKIQEAGLISPPQWLSDNTHYLTMMGSLAYGVSNDNSDLDVYGFCIPPKKIVFPHLDGEIQGFGRQSKRFDQWQQHHINYKEKEYDFSVYSIVRFFHLCMENNPNMIDALFVPRRCIIHASKIAELVRENRHMFLHKGIYFKLKGYAYSQLHKMRSKNAEGKRVELIEKYGFDVKFGYHLVRLLSQCEQVLTEGDLVLDEKSRREHMKAIRRGEVTQKQLEEWFEAKELTLEKLYRESKLQNKPDEEKIKELLLKCLEEHYGSLSNVVHQPGKERRAIEEIKEIVERFN